jgi:hypothetical protein
MKSSKKGMRITLRDEGEGWFPEYANQTVSGTVEQVIPMGYGNNCYVVLFDLVLELQERGFPTPSGYGLNRYSQAVIRSRWQDEEVQTKRSVSVHVVLIREGQEPPATREDIKGLTPRIWADCCVS